MKKTFEHIGLGIPTVLLPKKNVDLHKWAVVACDQYTSEPEYWEEVKRIAGDAPSTLNIVYPEVFLNESDAEAEKRIASIREHMNQYLEDGIFEEFEGLIYLERQAAGRTRKGLIVAIDLEKYEYARGSKSLVRATEGTIVERIPPRVKIRDGAPLESPHIMVLIDDPENAVLGPLSENREELEKAYDFKLMQDSGHLTGYKVTSDELEQGVIDALSGLADPAGFTSKYGLPEGTPVLLYAMGDGNHSLATAKSIWETTKAEAGDPSSVMDDPRRFALVELVNLHDDSLIFEPIHRVVFKLAPGVDICESMKAHFGNRYVFGSVTSESIMKAMVNKQRPGEHKIGIIDREMFGVVTIKDPDHNLPVGTIQEFLDTFMKAGNADELDYVHGFDTVVRLGKETGNVGIYLPAMDKNDLFKTVILDGALPRKTFSMGEAEEKRFYLECRKIAE